MSIEDGLALYVERMTESHYRGPGMPWGIEGNYHQVLRPTTENIHSTFRMVFLKSAVNGLIPWPAHKYFEHLARHC